MSKQLYTVGYQRWSSAKRLEKLIAALQTASVNTLIDIRHSPCASNPKAGGMYGPTDINLQVKGQGLSAHLEDVAIEYQWFVELGHPQKNDPAMTILRQQLVDLEHTWPVHRGIKLLQALVLEPTRRVAILCACRKHENCHRSLIAGALAQQIPALAIANL